MIGKANALAVEHNFFHWPLEFPDVFEHGGFDVMLGNPPWERINLERKEFFENRNKEISSITKSEQRNNAILELEKTNLSLFNEYTESVKKADKMINFFKSKAIFKYGNSGSLNTYPLFTEIVVKFIRENGGGGLVIPSGFFGDDTISPLFRYCVENDYLDNIYDFENTKNIFPAVHRQTRFSLVTFRKGIKNKKGFDAKFYLTDPIEIASNKENTLLHFDYPTLKLLNPNNLVCPSFKSMFEFNLNKKLFKFGVLKDDEEQGNDIEVHRMIHMSGDSNLLINNYFENSLPLYESKLIYHYDHRYSTFENVSNEDKNKGNAKDVDEILKQESTYKITPRYYCDANIFVARNSKWDWQFKWYLIYRVISASTNERTAIAAIIPTSVVSYSANIIFIKDIKDNALQMSLMNTIIFDFVARSKVNLNFPPVILFQTPRVRKSDITHQEQINIFSSVMSI